jgi:hypothetical protein
MLLCDRSPSAPLRRNCAAGCLNRTEISSDRPAGKTDLAVNAAEHASLRWRKEERVAVRGRTAPVATSGAGGSPLAVSGL